jgi:hypothetical protein
MVRRERLNLETVAVSTRLAQPIDLLSISEESLVTNKVAAISSDTLDKSIDYTMHALPTAVSRLNLETAVFPTIVFYNNNESIYKYLITYFLKLRQ